MRCDQDAAKHQAVDEGTDPEYGEALHSFTTTWRDSETVEPGRVDVRLATPAQLSAEHYVQMAELKAAAEQAPGLPESGSPDLEVYVPDPEDVALEEQAKAGWCFVCLPGHCTEAMHHWTGDDGDNEPACKAHQCRTYVP
jgi:hypothetical protein